MNKKGNKGTILLTVAICLVLAGVVAFFLIGIRRLDRNNQRLDEQFLQEQEKTRETIDKLKEQEAELDSAIADIKGEDADQETNGIRESQSGQEMESIEEAEPNQETGVVQESESGQEQNGIPEVTPTQETLLVSILDCLQVETLKESSLYMDNPGIYFTAQQIVEGDEIYQRAKSQIDSENISLRELRYLKMPYYNTKGEIQVGEMIVKASISQEVLSGCLELFQEKRGISSMNLDAHIWITEEKAQDILDKLTVES